MKPIKKRLWTLLLLLMSIGLMVNAQHKDIYLSGKITDTAVLNYWDHPELNIRIADAAKQLNSEEDIIKVPVANDGSFKIRIKAPEKLFHLSFWTNYKSPQADTHVYQQNLPGKNSFLDQAYLFEAGDSIQVNFLSSGIRFSGTGADKLNCQFQMYNTDAFPNTIASRASDLISSGDYTQVLTLRHQILQLAIATRLKLLDSYRDKFGDEISGIIKLDATSIATSQNLSQVSSYTLIKTQKPIKKEVQHYFKTHYTDNDTLLIDSIYGHASDFYLEMLFEKQWNAHKLFSKTQKTGDSFKIVYEGIKANYRGAIRDKLLMICFRRLKEYFLDQTRLYIDDAIGITANPRYKNALSKWKQKLYTPFPFDLEDTKGNIHKLSDYKGKVVVMDFWFTGCSWCKYLNAAMHTVIEKYKNNPNVVFITVSLDQKKELWLKSIASGQYTSPGALNLYTGELGFRHPMMLYYNFFSAPQQVIIGKNGDLISTAPPRPSAIRSAYEEDANFKVLPVKPEAVLTYPSTIAFLKIIDDLVK